MIALFFEVLSEYGKYTPFPSGKRVRQELLLFFNALSFETIVNVVPISSHIAYSVIKAIFLLKNKTF